MNYLTVEDIAVLAVAQVDAEDRMEAQQAQAQAQEQAQAQAEAEVQAEVRAQAQAQQEEVQQQASDEPSRGRSSIDLEAGDQVDDWTQCSRCAKWRRGVSGVSTHAHWQRSFGFDEAFNRCALPEESLARGSGPWYETYWQVECYASAFAAMECTM